MKKFVLGVVVGCLVSNFTRITESIFLWMVNK